MEQGSWIRKMFEEGIALKQRLGEDKVFDLSLGNPIMEPPREFTEELQRVSSAPSSGAHRYMPNAGYPETRTAVARALATETRLPFTSAEVVMACGAGGALNVVCKTLLEPGEEVLAFAPYFVEYVYYADNHGGTCKVVPFTEGFMPDLTMFEEAINSKTRIVLINSPNNPTGVVYSHELLRLIGQIIQRKERKYNREIFLVSDEPYRKILFDNLKYPHIFDIHPHSIVATSHSKDLALPGERIGYIAIHPDYPARQELVDGLTFSTRVLGFVNAPALIQRIVANLQEVTIDVAEYQSKRDSLYNNLVEMGYDVVRPQGAFYMFPKSPIEDDVAFVAELQQKGVLVVPGRGFGAPGYFRIAYCVHDSTLQGAIPGLHSAIQNYV